MAGYVTVAFIYLYSGVHNLGWTGASMLYVVEVLPYSMRSKGIALFWLVTGLAGAFNTYVNPLGIKAFGWKFYWFYVAWIAVEFAVVWWQCPETKGVSLEDIAILIDGEKATVSKMNPAVEAAVNDMEDKKAEAGVEIEHADRPGREKIA